ncbi:MAG: hypothetical protein NC416_06125 [Eubacterium sp.]|nr:hypothetical protein [Eubacterium sp.]
MKKLLALILAGSMLCAMPVMAAKSPSASAVSDKTSETASEKSEETETSVEAVEAASVPVDVIMAAAAEGKTVGEYLNNAVATVPGLAYVLPVGQGGHVIINGAPSNQVFSVLKPALASVSSAKTFAAAQGGRVLNVVRINASVTGFQTARVNFYMVGVTAGQNIKVFQNFNGQWLEVEVAEIRKDHVVVDMTSLGTLAFIEMPK